MCRISSWWPAGGARTVNDRQKQKKRKLRVRTGHLLYSDAFWDLRMLIHFASLNPEHYSITFIEYDTQFYFLSCTLESHYKKGKLNGAVPELENYSWFDFPLVQDLQIISISFRSYTKKCFDWTLSHSGEDEAVFWGRPVFLQSWTDHCKPHKWSSQIKHIFTFLGRVLQPYSSTKTGPLLLELDLSFFHVFSHKQTKKYQPFFFFNNNEEFWI